jgi:SAM-dependent methyltransferase
MRLKRQTAAWYDRLPTLQEGYYYPWSSQLAYWHGEDHYLTLVQQHLHANMDVLDVACGHGVITNKIAPFCHSVLGYDRSASWIDLAQQNAVKQGVTNVSFLCHDSSLAANDGQARIPAADNSFDLLIGSKGPFHWIEDARRVARPGAVLLMLVPDATPVTAWHSLLPESLQWQLFPDRDWARPAIEQCLTTIGLAIHSWWSFDVPEIFENPEQLYLWLTWGNTPEETPSLAESLPLLERIFAEYGHDEGVAVRYRRYLWKAVVPA